MDFKVVIPFSARNVKNANELLNQINEEQVRPHLCKTVTRLLNICKDVLVDAESKVARAGDVVRRGGAYSDGRECHKASRSNYYSTFKL